MTNRGSASHTERTYSSAQRDSPRPSAFRKSQDGAVAIEFAVLFGIFFAILYAIIAYSLPLLLMLTFKQVAADAARAAIAVDPAVEGYTENLESEVVRVIELSWIKDTGWYASCAPDGKFHSRPLNSGTLTVCIRYKTDDYNADPIVPALLFPGIGPIPRLPDLIEGSSTIRL